MLNVLSNVATIRNLNDTCCKKATLFDSRKEGPNFNAPRYDLCRLPGEEPCYPACLFGWDQRHAEAEVGQLRRNPEKIIQFVKVFEFLMMVKENRVFS